MLVLTVSFPTISCGDPFKCQLPVLQSLSFPLWSTLGHIRLTHRRQTTCSSSTTTRHEAGSNRKSGRTDRWNWTPPVRACTMHLRELFVYIAIVYQFTDYPRLPHSLFEGMKAYRSSKPGSKPVLFRPDMNMARMRRSAARVRLPVCPLRLCFSPFSVMLTDLVL